VTYLGRQSLPLSGIAYLCPDSFEHLDHTRAAEPEPWNYRRREPAERADNRQDTHVRIRSFGPVASWS